VQAIIDAGCYNKNVRDSHKCTPLHYAAQYGQVAVVKYLISIGADIHAQDGDGDTPLHCAAAQSTCDEQARLDIVKDLIAAGANMSLCNKNERTSAQDAAKLGHAAIADYIMRVHGAQVRGRMIRRQLQLANKRPENPLAGFPHILCSIANLTARAEMHDAVQPPVAITVPVGEAGQQVILRAATSHQDDLPSAEEATPPVTKKPKK
jgi:hypothetical protein